MNSRRSSFELETGKLYKLILRNASDDPHYFTSHAFSQMVFTRKAQVTQQQNGKPVTLAEFKGAIREIEVYPGQSAEWWLVPIAAGRASDLRCDIKTSDGKTHAELGMTRRDRDRVALISSWPAQSNLLCADYANCAAIHVYLASCRKDVDARHKCLARTDH